MVSGSLALLLFIGLDLTLGSRAAAPIGDKVLWNGEKFRPSVPEAWLVGPEAWLVSADSAPTSQEAC